MKVKDVMTKDVIYVRLPGSREDVLTIMKEKGRMGIPVLKKNSMQVVGIVTSTDLLSKPYETQLALLMTRDPITVRPDDDISKAAELMFEKNIRRIPVVENGSLVGIISVADIVHKIIADLEETPTIGSLMKRYMTTVWSKTPLNVAFSILKYSGMHALPVLDDRSKLCGIISLADFLRISEEVFKEKTASLTVGSEGEEWSWDTRDVVYVGKMELVLPDKLVEDVMIRDVITAFEETEASACAKKMRDNDIDQLPVVDAEGNLIGIISDVDLLQIIIS